jgi:hypothetical protein
MQFRKKPVVIEAFQFQQPTSVGEAPAWLTEAVTRGDFLVVDGVAHITTLEGIMTAQPGDWIIRGVKGEIYPCKPDIFAATYDQAAPSTTDAAIEQEIQAKGKTAPRVTPADIEANIAASHYFTAKDGVIGDLFTSGLIDEPDGHAMPESLGLLTFCVLTLRNGFTVTGESACASPENFDAEIGRKIARENAVQKVWPLMGYALKQQLHDAAA